MNRQDTLEDQLYRVGLWLLGGGCVLTALYLKFLVPVLPEDYCLFRRVLGIYCPGCGGTRAVEALLDGKLLLSLWYHPLVLYGAVVFGGFMLTNTLERLHIPHVRGWKFHEWYLWTAIVIVAGNWILRNFLLLRYHITL